MAYCKKNLELIKQGDFYWTRNRIWTKKTKKWYDEIKKIKLNFNKIRNIYRKSKNRSSAKRQKN